MNTMSNKKVVLSCIQPTGNLHFGRYFGAIKNCVDLQDQYETYYGVVDYHAMTMPYRPDKLRQAVWDVAFNLLSCGIKKENLFIQSLVPEHSELAWILGCFTSYGQMTRMTQFKEKSKQANVLASDDFIATGLFTYPVLQAADILIYKADYVPVGKDQEQHLELTRNIAHRFNTVLNNAYFNLPEGLYTDTPKIMSTADPKRKMSASMGDKHNIDVFAEAEKINKQIRSAVTDTGESVNKEMSPGVKNLFEMLKASGKEELYNELLKAYENQSLQYSTLKEVVAEALISVSDPFREKKHEILADKKRVKNEIKAASAEIRKIAQKTLREVKELTGLLNVRM